MSYTHSYSVPQPRIRYAPAQRARRPDAQHDKDSAQRRAKQAEIYEEVRRWNFINAWPSKISGPQISADSNDLAIEELTIVHEGMWADAPGLGPPNRAPDG